MLKNNKKLIIIITLALSFNIIPNSNLTSKVYASTLTSEQQKQIINDKESYLESLNKDNFLDEMSIWTDNILVFKNALESLKKEEFNAKDEEDYINILKEYKESENTINFTKSYNNMLDKVVNNKFPFFRDNLNKLEEQYNDMYGKFNEQENNFKTVYNNFKNGISTECYDEYNKILNKTNSVTRDGDIVLNTIRTQSLDNGNKSLNTYKNNVTNCENEITAFKNKYNKNSSPAIQRLLNNLDNALGRAKLKLGLCNLAMQKKELNSDIKNKPDLIPNVKPNIIPDIKPNISNDINSNTNSNVLDELSNILDQIHKLNNKHQLNNVPKLNDLSTPRNIETSDNLSKVGPSDNKNTEISKDNIATITPNNNNIQLPKTGINSFMSTGLVAAISTILGFLILLINKFKRKNIIK